ncbi:MAG: tetratricopeptide repeat protein [Gemmatimonadaceae bacterium]|nr:tetratricopeptide repeat protein [Gemmatimonadaceae bacterium]
MTPLSQPTVSIREADRLRAIARRVPVANAGAQNNCGVMLARRGLALDAAACFERALDVDARMSLAQQNLQQLAQRTPVDAERVQQLTDRLRVAPDDAATALALGKWHARIGRPADAARVLGDLLDRAPDDLAALREMALVEQALGYPDRASAWLERALGLEPLDVSLHALAGEILYRRGRTEAARAALERALAIDESAAWPQHLLAFVLGDLGQLDAAQAAAQRALQLDPNLARVDMHLTLDARPPKPAARVVGSSDGRAHLTLGIAYRNTGYHDQALAEFETALARGEPAAQVHAAVGETRLLRREWALAAAAWERAAEAMPGACAPRVMRAAMLVLADDLVTARATVGEALLCDVFSGSAHLILGIIEALEQHPVEALAALQRVRGSARVELAARLNAAWVMRQLGRHAECLEGFRRVTEADPQNARAWIGVGVAFNELRRLNEACSAFERAVALAPELIDAAYHLAFTLSQLGRYQDGVRAMKRAMAFEGEFAPFRFVMALDPELPEAALEVVVNDAMNGDAMALMLLSGGRKAANTAEHSVILHSQTPVTPMRAAIRESAEARQAPHTTRSRTPLGAWVALRRGGTPVSMRVTHGTPVIPLRRVTGPQLAIMEPAPRTAHSAQAVAPMPPASVVMRHAESALRTALAGDPDLAQVRVALAAMLREDGRVREAEKELMHALESVPTFHDAARALAELRVDVGRPSDGMQALVRPLRANPRDPDLLVALAEALLALNREEQALHAIARAAAVAPDHAGVRTLQGYMAQRAGRESEALAHWRVATRSGGANGENRWATRARLALAEYDDAAVPQTPVIIDSVRRGTG